jgi:hypothetical protein
MAGGNAGAERQVELAEPAMAAPMPKLRAEIVAVHGPFYPVPIIASITCQVIDPGCRAGETARVTSRRRTMDDTMLKRAFLVDGLGSLASVALLIGGASALSGPLGLSQTFLSTVGWLLLPVALLFFWIARTGSRPLAMVGLIGNEAWVVASAIAIPVLQPTLLGAVVIAGQAAAVAAIAWFEYHGLKRARVAA